MGAAEWAGNEPALRALQWPFECGELTWPRDGRVLFLGARADAALCAWPARELLCTQPLRPFADALQARGLQVGEPAPDDPFDLVLALPPRQRDARRALLARALGHVAAGGMLVTAAGNNDGARSLESDLAQLAWPVRACSKYKCRVLWVQPEPQTQDADVRKRWLALATLRRRPDGLWSRPGLFAWDRVDAASALLAACLPDSLHGRVADLGAGTGYLSVELLRRCPRVTAVDLYEADARALPAARANMREAGRDVEAAVHWHDVAAGIPGRYDAIISNPPFHQGRADLPQLGRAFIAAAAAALVRGGVFWMVANRHLAYEATLREHFTRVTTHLERDGYKVIEACR